MYAQKKLEESNRARKVASSHLPTELLERYMSSDHVRQEIDLACKVYEKTAEPPTEIHEARKLRNVLMTTLAIDNIRRSLEMTAFQIQEMSSPNIYTVDNEDGTKGTVLNIASHKTSHSSKVVMNF